MTGERTLCVTFLDVGQGDATIILPPEGEGDPIVFDCGADGWDVAQQLRVWDVQRIEAVIASHLDFDHIGGMATLLDTYQGRIKAVYFPYDRDITEDHEDAKQAKKLGDKVKYGGAPGGWEVRAVHRDAREISAGEDWSVHVIAPRGREHLEAQRTGQWDEPNRYSAVVRVRMADKTIVIGGDAPLISWSELKQEEGAIASDVFRVPHHGGDLSDGGTPDGWSATRLYDELQPEVAALSVGTNNPYGHPERQTWIAPLIGRSGCRLLCTQVTGQCHAPFARDTGNEEARKAAIHATRAALLPQPYPPYGDVNHFSEPPWRHYTQRQTEPRLAKVRDRLEIPCAGTISVRIDAHGKLSVDPSEENPSLTARIDRWKSPLCR